eukprot:gb/GFBE01070166.1/.p1 GENE.gb/GFBE01070166.1/~~gb/GFBE01070166.1/.p1  ORF type:complete len:644 (+),score=147.53 gb/GFBE01070166.1/:1-1932(+)
MVKTAPEELWMSEGGTANGYDLREAAASPNGKRRADVIHAVAFEEPADQEQKKKTLRPKILIPPAFQKSEETWVSVENSYFLDGHFVEHGPVFVDAEEMKAKVRQALLRPTYDVSDFYYTTGYFQALARHPKFENLTLLIIAVNAIWMAIDTDHNRAASILEADVVFQVAENFFCAFFVFELIIRFGAFRNKCNCCKDAWFMFDSLLVTLMVVETWVLTAIVIFTNWLNGEPMPLGQASILRMFRLLRLTRMARMLRSMPELMILVKGMVAATRSVISVMCLLIITMYVASILFTQLADGTAMGAYYFPTVQTAMYSLLIYGTFLDDLGPFCDEVGAESAACLFVVFIFVLISALTILNMLIGVLCEVVSAVAATEREEMMVTFVTNKLQGLLLTMDSDSDGMISKAEFMRILELPDAALALAEVGIDPVTIVDFSDYIFGSSQGPLPFAKFMEQILNLRQTNEATIRDMVDLRKFLTHQVETAEEVILSGMERKAQREAKRAAVDRKGPQDTLSSTKGAASFSALKTRVGKLEEMMVSTLLELRGLSHRIPGVDNVHAGTVFNSSSKSLGSYGSRSDVVVGQQVSTATVQGYLTSDLSSDQVNTLPRAQVLPRTSSPTNKRKQAPSSSKGSGVFTPDHTELF